MAINHQVNFTRWRAQHLEPEGYRPEGVIYHSAVLSLLHGSLPRKTAPTVLHLGRLRPGILELLSDARPRLITLEVESPDGCKLLDYLKSCNLVFDLFIIWDCLLYLPEEQRSALLGVLQERSISGSSLVTYTSTRRSIPLSPSRYVVSGSFQVEIIPSTTHVIANPLPDLSRTLPGWRSLRSVQLRNGFREHLLVRA